MKDGVEQQIETTSITKKALLDPSWYGWSHCILPFVLSFALAQSIIALGLGQFKIGIYMHSSRLQLVICVAPDPICD
jgi:hypothetical protein